MSISELKALKLLRAAVYVSAVRSLPLALSRVIDWLRMENRVGEESFALRLDNFIFLPQDSEDKSKGGGNW